MRLHGVALYCVRQDRQLVLADISSDSRLAGRHRLMAACRLHLVTPLRAGLHLAQTPHWPDGVVGMHRQPVHELALGWEVMKYAG